MSELTLSGQLPGFTPAWWALLTDRRLSDGAKVLYLTIGSHTRGHRNIAWPGQARLVELTGSSPASVKRYLAELVKAGWLGVERPNRRLGNRYIVMMPSPQAVENLGTEPHDEPLDSSLVSPRDSSPVTPVSKGTRSSNPPKPPRTPRRRNLQSVDADHRPQDFLRWWTAYPNRTGRAMAEDAWCRAQSHATPLPSLQVLTDALDLMERSLRDQHPDGQEWKRFVPHPTTWLNQQRWRDLEALPVEVRAGPCIVCGSPDRGADCRLDLSIYPEEACPWRT